MLSYYIYKSLYSTLYEADPYYYRLYNNTLTPNLGSVKYVRLFYSKLLLIDLKDISLYSNPYTSLPKLSVVGLVIPAKNVISYIIANGDIKNVVPV